MIQPVMTPSDHIGTPAGLSLAELAAVLSEHGAALTGDASARVTGVHQDSRRVEPGDLFVARSGAQTDGTAFVDEAVRRGAVAVLVERGRAVPDVAVPILRVDDVRRALARAAEAVHGYPSRQLSLIGITGTNGKTTTSFLVEHALRALGARPGRLGTLGFALPGTSEVGAAQFTTPEADEISGLLARARRAGATHFVMEVSSHALEQSRVAALAFDVAAFTNLTQDHLDFHGTMDRYAAAKARLFTELRPRHAVINVGDAFGATLAATTTARRISVSRTDEADLRALGATLDERGIHAEVAFEGRTLSLTSRLLGAHNLENLLLAAGVLVALGYPPEEVVHALGSAPPVPGRLERCDGPDDDVLVVVDYAHTPDALRRVLTALRPLTRRELVCVFGCGGDRDPGKRPQMGAIAGELADRVVVTNDNPRTEEPSAIAHAIARGLADRATPFVIELDRARAIEQAVLAARAGDTVLVAGKGHEDYQIFGHDRRPFDDRAEARRALALRRGREEGAS